MQNDLFLNYLNILVEHKIYPFAPLEINFIINLVWMLIRSLFKSVSEYRYSQGVSGYFQFKMINFMLSFLVMFIIFISLDFWLTTAELNTGWLIFLPSIGSIILQEIAILVNAIFSKTDDSLSFEEKQMEKAEKELSLYFALSFIVLAAFWGYMLIDKFKPSLSM